jgi:hypothetical protein
MQRTYPLPCRLEVLQQFLISLSNLWQFDRYNLHAHLFQFGCSFMLSPTNRRIRREHAIVFDDSNDQLIYYF